MAPPPPPPRRSASTQPWSSQQQQQRPMGRAQSFLSSGDSVTMLLDSTTDDTRSQWSRTSSRKRHESRPRRPTQSAQRPVALTDRRLTVLAHETSAMIHWDRILRAPPTRAARWKWTEHCGDFSLYVKHESQRYAVLAIGVVNGSVHETAALLQAATQEQHTQRMEALHGDQFKHGAFVHDVEFSHYDMPPPPVESSNGNTTLAQLSVKTATYAKSKMLSSNEQWCYLDAIYTDSERQVFEKHMTTLHPEDVYEGKSPTKTKDFHDVVCGYSVQPEEPQERDDRLGSTHSTPESKAATHACAKVHFYAELFTPKHFGFNLPALTDKAIRLRLVRMAQSCARLPLLVRRKRLGVQVLIDQNRFFPPSNVPCAGCDKLLLFAKLCRLCGHGVCDNCSRKHERESRNRRSNRLCIESVRVCDRCIERVDATDYSQLGDASLFPPGVVPDRKEQQQQNSPSVLAGLLQDALLNASSREMKASVMNVIKCVLDQEDTAILQSPAGSAKSILLTPTSTDLDYVRALRKLEMPTVLYSEAPVASANGRAYALDPVSMAAPKPSNEDQRLKAIHDSHIRQLGKSEELNMICNLVAKELGCFASLVTVIGSDDLYIAASSLPMLENQSFARDDAFCAHTIMTHEPLIVHHPEADVRFHMSPSVQILGAKYYCGFPLIADDTVIGSVCAVDNKTRELTESEYSYLQKLAETAAKIVKLHADQRNRKMSTMSDRSGSSDPQSQPKQ